MTKVTESRIRATNPIRVWTIALATLLFAPVPGISQYAGVDIGSSTSTARVERPSFIDELEPARESPAATEIDTEIPFGSNLFTGGFANEKEDGLNPDYVIAPGDQIELRVWGATEINEILTVDPRGNIFIPKVGPVTVSGARNDQLNSRVTRSIRKVYTDNVQVYTSLSSTQPVAVFVTGFVNNPGRYAGVASNSILFFIDRAAGIDPERGSYRRIDVLRNQKRIATADLYEFLLSGKLPAIQLRDGDTILINQRGNTISVSGDARNEAVFEIIGNSISGSQLLDWARPVASASHALWTGVRNGAPNARYFPLSNVPAETFKDGDRLEILTDAHHDVITVKVEGAFEGPSQFVVTKNTRLGEVLDMIQIPRQLAAYESVSIRRESIVEQQRQSIEESLRRLESAYLRASSETNEEAAIRTVEAKLIADFVKRARQAEPSGRLVLRNPDSAQQLRLQNGDIITVPERTESVLITGEVLIPQAILYDTGMSLSDYIALSGGFTELADEDTILLIRQNGEVLVAADSAPLAGDQLMVLPEVPSKELQYAKEIVDVLYKVAIATGVLLDL